MARPKKEVEHKIGTLADKRDESYIPTGIVAFDELLGLGLPRGRIVELWGGPSVGKTHIATLLMANISKDYKVLYVDSEFGLNKERVKALGADPANIGYIADSRLENVCEALIAAVGKFDVIILDSLAQLTPMAVANAEVGERSIGLFALLIKHWVLKFRPLLANSHTAFIALNQYRPPIGLYATETPPGGMAFVHACDVRIKLTTNSSDKIMGKIPGTAIESDNTGAATGHSTQLIGHYVHLTVKKNRLGAPGKETKVAIKY